MAYIGNKPSAVPLTSADITDGIITSAKIADGTIVNADINASAAIVATKLTGISSQPFRNIVINGDMQIAQRGTSFSFATGSGAFYYGADRFATQDYTWSAGTNPTVSNDTTVYPTGFRNSYKYATGATGLTLAAGGIQFIKQSIEGYNIADCYTGNITLSFWVRASTAGQYNIMLTNNFTSLERYITKNYTINSANTWEKKTITVDLSAGITSGGTWNTTNGHGLSLVFILGAHANRIGNDGLNTWATGGSPNYSFQTTGSVNLATIANSTFNITGVQLEAGTSATDFEFLPIDVSLGRCQRYFSTNNVGNNLLGSFCFLTSGFNTTEAFGGGTFPVFMRTTPTVSVFDDNGTALTVHRTGGGAIALTSVGLISNSGFSAINSASLFIPDRQYLCTYKADAEL